MSRVGNHDYDNHDYNNHDYNDQTPGAHDTTVTNRDKYYKDAYAVLTNVSENNRKSEENRAESVENESSDNFVSSDIYTGDNQNGTGSKENETDPMDVPNQKTVFISQVR